jgi:segregation and condensation protein A
MDPLDTEQMELPYHVRLEKFEGPLDLLLHLIKKNEVNIYDIPIALITKQYLDYLTVMKTLNLAVAGEFLVVAATLVQIKSKMLLPVDEREEEGEEGPDPREELVRRLLEYKKYKEAASQFDSRDRLWRSIFYRVPAPAVDLRADETLLDDVTLFDLVDALQGVLNRVPDQGLLEITPEHLTVQDRMNAVLEALENRESLPFLDLFVGCQQRIVIIVTFLALLELIRTRLIRVFQGETFGPILVTRAFSLVNSTEVQDEL